MQENELLHILALQNAKGVGDILAKRLLAQFETPSNIFRQKISALTTVNGVSQVIAKDLLDASLLIASEAELTYIKQNNINTHYFDSPDYPKRLKHCIDAPILLFSTGNFDIHEPKMISIVGTRNMTSYGRDFCNKLIEDLAPYNPTIVSGFAYGVDICAHKAALDHNLPTIAMLAHGFDQIYPKTHKKYMHSIEKNGGFITEFWHDNKLLPANFIKRNRIIAGISEATIIIESAEKGGSLATADIANSYNRDVFAVPGRATDVQSVGCNELIKLNQAAIITSARDIVHSLRWTKENEAPKGVQKQLFVDLTSEEQLLYDYLLKNGKQDLDSLALACKWTTSKTATLLFQLEMKGSVKPLPGKLFEVG